MHATKTEPPISFVGDSALDTRRFFLRPRSVRAGGVLRRRRGNASTNMGKGMALVNVFSRRQPCGRRERTHYYPERVAQ